MFNLSAEPQNSIWEKYVGSIIAQKPIKNVAIHNVLKVAWAKYVFVGETDLKKNFLLVVFEDVGEGRQYWINHLDQFKVCFNIKKWKQTLSLNEVDFNCIQLWIQVHGLELGVLSAANARQIGEGIRKCI